MVVPMVVRAVRLIMTGVMVVMTMLLNGVFKRRVLYAGVREGAVRQQVRTGLCHSVCVCGGEGD